MSFIKVTSPHSHNSNATNKVMLLVLAAALPGIFALTLFFGFGTLSNLLLCSAFCLGFEAIILKLRKRQVRFYLKDYSALVTALLLAVAIPPYSPWWMIATGCFFAIVIAKQLYGGLGYNPFNPAMVAYVVLLISFPIEMSRWATPLPLAESQYLTQFLHGLSQVFNGATMSAIDGLTGATPLDIIKQRGGATIADTVTNSAIFSKGNIAGFGWETVNLAFLLGGVFLIYKRVFTWHAPVAMLATLFVCSLLFYDGGSSTSGGSIALHLFSGATMLGAFFIITDPVSSATSPHGKLVFGALIGLFTYVIRAWGNYPDALAFAVLLVNFAAPFIDYYTIPRSYGHKQRPSGIVKK